MGGKKNKLASPWLHKHPWAPYIFPTALVMLVLFVVPILFVFIISLTNYHLGSDFREISFLGFSNFTRLFTGEENGFYHSVGLSIGFMILGTILQLIFGMICAMLLNHEFKGKGLVIACLIIPIAVTPSIISQIWKLMFNSEFGVINYFLNAITGHTVQWLDSEHAFLSVLIATVWQYTPFVTLMMYAGLRSLPVSPYESAMLDGASNLQIFRYITLPLMKNLLILCTLLRAIDMLKTFDIPYVLTQGGPGNATKFLSLLIYDTGFGEQNFVGRASSMAVVLIVVVTLISLVLFHVQNKNREV